jgi:hypothetical protein
MIHLKSVAVPPYEHDDSLYLYTDPYRWPESKVILGREFALSITKSSDDVFSTHKSMSTVSADRYIKRLHLCYVSRWGKRGDLVVGPSYYWNEYGRLWQRVWYDPDTVTFRSTLYATYPSGQLFQYATAMRNQDISRVDSLIKFTEFFDRDGGLIGVSHVGGSRESQFWWKGLPISADQWNKSRGALFKAAFDRKR